MNEPEFDRRVRDARPPLPPRDAPLDATAQAMLHRITSEPERATELTVVPGTHTKRPTRKRESLTLSGRVRGPKQKLPARRASLALVVVAVMIVIAVGIGIGLPHGAAMAVTPGLLGTEPLAGTSRSVLEELSTSIASSSREAGDTVRYTNWALEFDGDEDAKPPQSITPTDNELVFDDEGSAVFAARAAQTVDAAGQLVENPDAPLAGELLWTFDLAPDDARLVAEPPPTDAVMFEDYLRAYDGTAETAGDYFAAISTLLAEWSLDSAQQAALVGFLASLPDITIEGSTTDRLGREGVLVSTSSGVSEENRVALVINDDVGVIAYEVVYIGDSRPDLRSPAVIEYYAWH